MEKLDGLTADIVAERVEELREVFPEVFKDGKIDFDALQNALGEYIEDAREKYSFTWAGKLDAIRLAQKRSTGTLRPCREESVDFDNTQNLYIEGDNLEVLKLLSGSYMNSVKMIYIDTPYNKGKDFIYSDNFTDSIEHYKAMVGEAAKSNVELSGRYHTN
jgi:adenine-specific DNA-methyltransferase